MAKSDSVNPITDPQMPKIEYKLTLTCSKSTARGPQIVSHMPRIDSHSLQIDSRNAKSNPDGPKLTSNSDKVISNIPVIPKSNSHIMLKIQYIFIPLCFFLSRETF